MSSKHDILTEEEMSAFNINGNLKNLIKKFLSDNPFLKKNEINILDWGCGRGRSVAKLREIGFNAFGIDIDEKTLVNGHTLFKERGYIPSEIIKPVKDIDAFPFQYFHIIFSEQVFEHIADISYVINLQYKYTKPNGVGLHSFPSSKMIHEEHLHLSFIHWLPKNFIRKFYIILMMLLGKGPDKNKWIETKNKSFFQIADIYYKYMNNKTYYRDNEEIKKHFSKAGFWVHYTVSPYKKKFYIPKYFSRNGFPKGSVTFNVAKYP